MKTKGNIYLICSIMIILLFQFLILFPFSNTFINYQGSSYEDDENTGGAGHGSLTDLQNRINHHFTSGYGVNCSGFVRAVIYTATGLDVLHNGNYIQDIIDSGYFDKISESNLKPGDVFYTNDTSAGHHIGIVTEVIGYDSNGTATFRTAESDGYDWTRVITKNVIYPGGSPYKFMRLKPEITSKQDIEGIIRWGNYQEEDKFQYTDEDVCLIIKGPVQEFLNTLFIIISIIGIILLIVMTALEFIKVVTGSDEEGIKTAFKHTIIRIVCIVILLILPMIINWILNVININFSEGYKIGSNGEPLCEVIKP